MSIFDSILTKKPKKSRFNLSHSRKFSFAPGKLYPTMLLESMPGASYSHDQSALIRMMPMQAPLMHLVDVYSYTFRVPMRLCMEREMWDVFITGGTKGDGKSADGVTVEIPYFYMHKAPSGIGGINVNWAAAGTLLDHLGISFGDADGDDKAKINAMPLLAYWLIWNEYFRDQNLHKDVVEMFPLLFNAKGDITALLYGAMSAADPDLQFNFFELPNVCWQKDMFTSALPWAQRGAPVETPLKGTATVTYKDVAVSTETPFTDGDVTVNSLGDFHIPGSAGSKTTGIDNIESVELVSGGFSINDLRVAARLQEWLEKMARGGSRYTEQLRSMFGVKSSDGRLQRPEYLAGGKMPVNISEVLQTSETAETALGTMSGRGLSAGHVAGWKAYFEEHCYIMSYMFMRPKTAYQQGIPRLFTHRFDKLDWPWPQFAQLGEQEVKMSELYATLDTDTNDETFGYQQRYAEMKYMPSTVHGEFKTTLNFWHWGSIFTEKPTLSPEFVECHPSPRIFNVIDENEDPCYCVLQNNLTAVLPLPYYGEPTL